MISILPPSAVPKTATYKEASNYVVSRTDLDNIQTFSYNNFIKNTIKRYMDRVYRTDSCEVRFVKWWLDTSSMLPIEVCKAKRKSLEVSLKALMEITFTDKFKVKQTSMPHNSVTVEVEVTRFPYLTERGNFIINGIDKVLISHLGKANKLFMRPPSESDKKQKGQLELSTSQGSTLLMNDKISFRNVRDVAKDCSSFSFTYNQVLQAFGILDPATTVNIVGVNNFFMNKIVSSGVQSDSLKNNENIFKVLNNFFLTIDERQSINEKLSYSRNLIDRYLAEDLKLEVVSFDKKGTVVKEEKSYQKYTKITTEMAEEIQQSGITSVRILEKGLSIPVLSNSFVDTQKLFKQYNLEIPDAFVVETKCPLDKNKTARYYMPCDKTEFDALVAAYGSDMEMLANQIELNVDRLIGHTLTKNDILAMINYFSRGMLKLVPYDDIDSLENKKIVNIADVFEKGLSSAIGVQSRYNKNINNKNSILARIEETKKRAVYSTDNNVSGMELLMNMDLNFDCGDNTITKESTKINLYNTEDSTNPLAQINHKRRITLQEVTDFGGVSSQSPDPSVRSNNPSYNGRIDIIETPESQSVGLVREVASLAFLNEFGQLEAPFFKVDQVNKVVDVTKVYYMTYDKEMTYRRVLSPRIAEKTGVKVSYWKDSAVITSEFYNVPIDKQSVASVKKLARHKTLKFKADTFKLEVHKKNWFIDEHLSILTGHGKVISGGPDDVEFVSCNGTHIFSPVTSAIPFIDFDDAARGMMGSVMSKQAIPVYDKQLQYVYTPMAKLISKTATGVILAPYDLEVVSVDALHIKVKSIQTGLEETISCLRQDRTSKTTLNKSIPIVKPGEWLLKGDVLADSTTTVNGELAHGTHLRIAIMPLNGDNYEDGVIFSERLVQRDIYTSIHLDEFELEVGKDELIDNKDSLSGTDQNVIYKCSFSLSPLQKSCYNVNAIIVPGTQVQPKDILACKRVRSTDKSSINDSNTATYTVVPVRYDGIVPGTVVAVESYEEGDSVIYTIKVANKLKIGVGDKYTGRHGNKGIICRILPIEDMPFDEYGNRMDAVINPLGIPSRMNIGQVLDGQLGLACHNNYFRAVVDILSNINIESFKKAMLAAGTDKVQLFDGQTGKPFRYLTNVVMPYVEKLEHVVSHKIHVRSFDPYTTRQQPTQGKAQNGGQRLGEMEFNSLEAHGAFNLVREFLAYKTDDVENRTNYKFAKKKGGNDYSALKGAASQKQNTPHAFQLTSVYYAAMFKRIRAFDADNVEIDMMGSANKTKPGRGRNLQENIALAKSRINALKQSNEEIDFIEEEDEFEEDFGFEEEVARAAETLSGTPQTPDEAAGNVDISRFSVINLDNVDCLGEEDEEEEEDAGEEEAAAEFSAIDVDDLGLDDLEQDGANPDEDETEPF